MMNRVNLESLAETLAHGMAENTAERDLSATFATNNHKNLQEHKLFSALIPLEIGGGGAKYSEMAKFLRKIAKYNASTALALAMHQHLISAAVYNNINGKPGRKLMDTVVADETILVSTGANDWMESNGEAIRTQGGYIVTARKPFASGSTAAHVLVTSVRVNDPELGAQVLHFSIPIKTDGISFSNDWDTLGMRESGSQTIILERVFIPDRAIILTRPQQGYCAIFDVVLPCALPLIMSVYLGVAEAAAEIAVDLAKKREGDEVTPFLIGEMINHLTTAQITVNDMISLTNNLEFTASAEVSNAILIRKTIAVNAVVNTVEKAMEAAGGAGFYRKHGLERMLRDIHAAQFHPMQEKRQHQFSGRIALSLPPVE
ncbi:MAG: acyl-CoA dehydrogenase family protein [Halopseudomonas aestusnigri]